MGARRKRFLAIKIWFVRENASGYEIVGVMLVGVVAVMGIAHRVQRSVAGSFDATTIDVLHHVTEVIVLLVL